MNFPIVKEDITKMLDLDYHDQVSSNIVNDLNNLRKEEVFGKQVFTNFMTCLEYTNDNSNNNFDLEEYLKAIKFCSFKLLNENNLKLAYKYARPVEYKQLRTQVNDPNLQNITEDTFKNIVKSYNNSYFVKLIDRYSSVFNYASYAPLTDISIKVLGEIAKDENSKDKDRIEACKAILDHVKAPDSVKEYREIDNISAKKQDTETPTISIISVLDESIAKDSERTLKALNLKAKTNGK